MPMKPYAGESQSDFMSRCVPDMMEGDRDNEQAVAACLSMFREGKGASGIVHKQRVAEATSDLDFIMSDESVDRIGDVIEASGWDLANFNRHPIALFNHNKHFPIGVWENVRVEKGQLRGRLRFAEPGTSARIDELRKLTEQGILRAVSVGFAAKERAPLTKSGGIRFKRSELLECSLVSIPANANALHLAKSLDISRDTLAEVFGKHAMTDQGATTRGFTAEHGATSPDQRARTMTTPIAKRIEDAQTKLTELKDQLSAHIETAGDEPDDAAMAATEELNGKIASQQRSLDALVDAEKQLAATTVVTRADPATTERRPFAQAADKVRPADHVMRSLVGLLVGKMTGVPAEIVIAERYGQDGKFDPNTKLVLSVARRATGIPSDDVITREMVTRAATAPATTTTSGWASQLVETAFSGFMELLMPASVYPGLATRGLRMNFGRAGVISIPTRSATPTIAGSFVAEGAPIPVRQGAFTAQTFTPKKMAVISSFTREIAEHSTPAIEGLIRNAIQEDTSVALDTVLLDATAASTTRPAGLRNGVTVTTATAGGGFAALVGDLKALVGALITASNNNIRQPVWIMNPVQALSIALTQNAGGDFPFAAEINNNRFQGYPVILSSNVTAAMVLLVDAADFVAIEGGAPRFDVSDQATIHLEDTTPLAIGTAGSPNTVAAPVRSLWQTDSMALRMIMDINWGMRRTGVVAWTQTVTW